MWRVLFRGFMIKYAREGWAVWPTGRGRGVPAGGGTAAPHPEDPWLLPKGLLDPHGSAACLG